MGKAQIGVLSRKDACKRDSQPGEQDHQIHRQRPKAKKIRAAPSMPKTVTNGVVIIAAADQGTPASILMPGGG